MIKIKDDSVSILGIRPELIVALLIADGAMVAAGVDTVITSNTEASTSHSKTSLHYSGAAIDLRTKHLSSDSEKRDVASTIREALALDFDVLLEGSGEAHEHLHIEWQPRRR